MKREEHSGAIGGIDDAPTASGTECTGLMPALPQSAAEDEASAALQNVRPAGRHPRKRQYRKQ